MCCSSVVASHSDRYCGACYQARPVSVEERSLICGMQTALTDRGGFPMPRPCNSQSSPQTLVDALTRSDKIPFDRQLSERMECFQ
jgi:hypothetical protein